MDSKIHGVEHSYFELKRAMNSIVSRYPFVSVQSVGRSVSGREIPALTLGSGEEYTLFVTGDDPTCRITGLILLRFLEELADCTLKGAELCGINIRKAMFGRGIIILPLLNPDGTEIALRGEMGCGYMAGKISKMCRGDFEGWRSNLRGVELKRNLAYNFLSLAEDEKARGCHFPSKSGFCGFKPDSEPESIALTELCRQKPIKNFIWLSAPGEMISYSGHPTPPTGSDKMAEVMAAVSGYKVVPPIVKNDVEISDRFTYDFSRPGLSVKVGEGCPPPVKELKYHYGRIKEMLTLAAIF